MTSRRRSSSVNEPVLSSSATYNNSDNKTMTLEMLQATQEVWELVCGYALEDPTTQQNLLHSTHHVCLAKALLDRAHQLDHYSQAYVASTHNTKKGKHNTNTPNNNNINNVLQSSPNWVTRMLQQGDGESGYTPLHWAVLHAKLPMLLLLLKYTAAASDDDDDHTTAFTPILSAHHARRRMLHRPLALLQGDVPTTTTSSDNVRAILSTLDKEGLTAGQLLGKLQVSELQKCRKSLLVYSPLQGMIGRNTARNNNNNPQQRPRARSIEAMLQADHEAQQNELAPLHQYMQQEQAQHYSWTDTPALLSSTNYACEVLSFGRSNHLALGVQGGKHHHHHHHSSSSSTDTTSTTSSSFRPHRVQTFAQDRVGRSGSAVAIAAAAHHTLVATREGHLYAFGVGTGGRLGTSLDEKHCPAPTRVLGPLAQRRVVAIAAAENHSLCCTSDGAVYAFGSNRFGQLGYSSTGSASSGGAAGKKCATDESVSRCALPRRVDDLWKKNVLCISVAAGEKHSVALSQKGEVYVFGCNASGQLGIHHRRSTSNSQMAHKVQRVDSLWTGDTPKRCFQIAASSQATLVLAKPNAGGLPVNQVYAWGHGNFVPSKVQFTDPMAERESQLPHKEGVFISSAAGRRSVNPTAISSARHHNVAITSDGRVFSWGFHTDPLGGQTSTATPKAAKNSCSRPQLVTAMLPENGGGLAVAVSASENHTAVVDSEGALWTWGASYGKGVLGHEGVRWQPSPKRVCGVNRAVGVSAAKEHTILLMGATFPSMKPPSPPEPTKLPSLEELAAKEVAKHIDLFNVLPILMTVERINCRYLVDLCQEFVRLNLDGVLNVSQKSIMDMYLDEQVASGLLLLDEDPRDRRERPLIMRVALATLGEKKSLQESETILSSPMEWMKACEKLSKKDSLKQLVNRMRRDAEARPATHPKLRSRSSSSIGSFSEAVGEGSGRPRTLSTSSDTMRERKMSSSERCIMLTTNMDLSTRESVQSKYNCLSKEIRGLKKRLSQIAKLERLQDAEVYDTDPNGLSSEQHEKIARRPQLESELCIFEPALVRVEKRMAQYNLRPRRLSLEEVDETKEKEQKSFESSSLSSHEATEATTQEVKAASLRCATCNIACPDETSYALHMSGRKHRNRVAQDAEAEGKRAAAAMMADRHRQQLQAMSDPSHFSRQAATAPLSAWSNQNAKPKSSAKPKYNLPFPPNQAQEIVEKKTKTLQEIMAEEAQTAAKVKLSPYSLGPLQLPAGSAPSMKSPPWASKQLVTPRQKPATSSVSWKSTASPKTKPLHLSEFASPSMSSPPWAVKPVKATSSPMVGSPHGQRSSNAFGDFLQKAPTPPLSARSPSTSAPWSAEAPTVNRPGFGKTPLVPKQQASANGAVAFKNIQKQEVDFKDVQDQTFQDNGKWFIERRERAGSLTTIQQAENTEREQQLMIEEQIRIEAEIMREVAALKKQEESKKKRQQQKTKKKNKNNEGGKQKPKSPNHSQEHAKKAKAKCKSGVNPEEKTNSSENASKGVAAKNNRRRKNSSSTSKGNAANSQQVPKGSAVKTEARVK